MKIISGNRDIKVRSTIASHTTPRDNSWKKILYMSKDIVSPNASWNPSLKTKWVIRESIYTRLEMVKIALQKIKWENITWLWGIPLCRFILHWISPSCWIVLHSTTLNCTELRCAALHNISLGCVVLCWMYSVASRLNCISLCLLHCSKPHYVAK